MNLSLRKVALTASSLLFAGQLLAEPNRPECIARPRRAVVST